MPAALNHITPQTAPGANLVPGGATFKVWAPNATAVHVRGSFNGFTIRDDALLVPAGGGYWHGYIAGVTDFDTYKYWITGLAGPGLKRELRVHQREPFAHQPRPTS